MMPRAFTESDNESISRSMNDTPHLAIVSEILVLGVSERPRLDTRQLGPEGLCPVPLVCYATLLRQITTASHHKLHLLSFA